MTTTSKEYAEALFALALECDRADEFYSALCDVRTVFENNVDYVEMLACYGIAASERAEALSEVFSDTLPEYVLSFLQLLCEQGKIKCFFDSVTEYEKLYSEHRKVSNALVYSASPLSDTQKKRLEQKLETLCDRAVSVEYRIDKGLMGGVSVEIDGKVIDGSVRHRLNEVKEVINR